MNSKVQKRLFGIPSWGLSLLAAVSSFIFLMFLGAIIGPVFPFDKDIGEVIAYLIYGIIIATACFFICRNDPNSIWYAPILCNIMGIIAAFVEPNFWITPLWILFSVGWLLSLIGAIAGAMTGRRSLSNNL
jgi:ABC-type polysaccharide/polyol phosphate export permease